MRGTPLFCVSFFVYIQDEPQKIVTLLGLVLIVYAIDYVLYYVYFLFVLVYVCCISL